MPILHIFISTFIYIKGKNKSVSKYFSYWNEPEHASVDYYKLLEDKQTICVWKSKLTISILNYMQWYG